MSINVEIKQKLPTISPRTEAFISDITNKNMLYLYKTPSVNESISDQILSISISNFVPYECDLKTILLYEITVVTKFKKYVIDKTFQQFKKLDKELKILLGKKSPSFPSNAEDSLSLENVNHLARELCEKLQSYLRLVLELPDMSNNDILKIFLDFYNTSPRSPKPLTRCKSLTLLNFEKSIKENLFLECQQWFIEHYVKLMQKGTICKRVLKTEISNFCIRLTKDRKSFEYDHVSSFSDPKHIKLNSTILLSDILDVRNELYVKSSIPGNKSNIIKSNRKKYFSFPTEDLCILKLIYSTSSSSHKKTLEFSINDKFAYKIWYIGISFLINKIPDQEFLSKIRSVSEFESNLAFLSINSSVIENNYFHPPTFPPPPI